MKCDFESNASAGGFVCKVCGFFASSIVDRDCPGASPPQATDMKKKGCCNKAKLQFPQVTMQQMALMQKHKKPPLTAEQRKKLEERRIKKKAQ